MTLRPLVLVLAALLLAACASGADRRFSGAYGGVSGGVAAR